MKNQHKKEKPGIGSAGLEEVSKNLKAEFERIKTTESGFLNRLTEKSEENENKIIIAAFLNNENGNEITFDLDSAVIMENTKNDNDNVIRTFAAIIAHCKQRTFDFYGVSGLEYLKKYEEEVTKQQQAILYSTYVNDLEDTVAKFENDPTTLTEEQFKKLGSTLVNLLAQAERLRYKTEKLEHVIGRHEKLKQYFLN